MPNFKIVPSSQYKNNSEKNDVVNNIISYILRPSKIPHNITGGIGVSLTSASDVIKQFKQVKKSFRKTRGIPLQHFIVSFSAGEEKLYSLRQFQSIGYQIAEYFNGEYQIVFALHEDSKHLHLHFAVNTVNFRTGKKMVWNETSFYSLKNFIETYTLTTYF